ncbi:MAG: hypothetical protein ACHQT5_00545 [Candidatus Saccharimonadales bacterium]|jgi:hypothetical protein
MTVQKITGTPDYPHRFVPVLFNFVYMSNNDFYKNHAAMQLFDAFTALQIITDQDYITGSDRWRHETAHDSLAAIDPGLVTLVQKQPPSKFGKPTNPSLWYTEHFCLALPALSYVFKKYGTDDETTSKIRLNQDELSKYFPAFHYLAKHYSEYHEFVEEFGVPTQEIWEKLLHAPLIDMSAGESVSQMLERLPLYLQVKAQQILSGQGDSLIGRIVLAYLLGQGVSPEDLKFDARTARYVAPMHGEAPDRSLYHRLVTAQAEMGELEPFLGHYEEDHNLLLGNFFGLVSWFGRPHMVEMVIPGLAGAAEPVVGALRELFVDICKNGGPDYTSVPIESLPSMQKFYATQSLEAIGKLSLVKDILSTDEITGNSDGIALRKLAAHIYTVEERELSWSNPEFYIPDARRSSGYLSFRQDIVDILYSAALFAENKHAASAVNTNTLKRLSIHLSACDSFDRMREIIQIHRQIINDLVRDWETRYAGHERIRILHFVRQTFGLDPVKPIAIPIQEINKGFAGSHVDGNVYRLRYQEAGEKLSLSIPVSLDKPNTPSVQYHTCKPYEKARISPSGIPFSAWLEVSDGNHKLPVIIPVPGRGSFDPFGRVGSKHAGEVLGFGCSVHHASLAIILAELASLGARREDLQQVTDSFMRINKGNHERFDLASFQLAETLAAFETGKVYTLQHFLKDRPQLVKASDRPQLSAYTQAGDSSLAWAEPQAARLSFGYPELYPYHEEASPNPRFSWYDGRDVELPAAEVRWRALSC